MYKEIEVGDKIVPMECNAATNVRFKHVFGKDLYDLLNDEKTAGENIDTISRIGYIASIHASKDGFHDKNEDTYVEWLEGFEPFDLINASEQIINLYYSQQGATSVSKKKAKGRSAD